MHFPHDPVTLLITYGNIHDIVVQHKLIHISELTRIVTTFRKDCPAEWVDQIVRLCPHTFRRERDFVWIAHTCSSTPDTCGMCRCASDELRILLVSNS